MFKYSEEELVNKLALIFGWSKEKVLNARFTEMMCKLVDVIEEYEKLIAMQNETIEANKVIIESIEGYISILKKVHSL
jgi:hypothetical protein